MKKHLNIVAIIQARMGSTRLPGKVLMSMCGKPLLWHVIDRLGHSKLINKIVIATSTNKNDDIIEDFCRTHRIDFHRGSENDVLDRYYQAAKFYKADPVVRITADCPLIDPRETGRVIAAYLEKIDVLDGASNVIDRSYPRGLDTELVSFSTLKRIHEEAKADYQREHVTNYMYEHKEVFKIYSVKNSKNLGHLRWTVDEEQDLIFVRAVYNKLYKQGRIFLINDVLKLLEKEPHLKEINSSVMQKAA